jgi:hypothetical protein
MKGVGKQLKRQEIGRGQAEANKSATVRNPLGSRKVSTITQDEPSLLGDQSYMGGGRQSNKFKSAFGDLPPPPKKKNVQGNSRKPRSFFDT